MADLVADLADGIEKALEAISNTDEDPVKLRVVLAKDLASEIQKYIKGFEIPAGIAVATAGSPTAQTGATTAPAKLI